MRTPHAALLLGSALCLSSCFGHHTADEEVLKRGPSANEDPSIIDEDEDDDEDGEDGDDDGDDRPSSGGADAGVRQDAGRATDAGRDAGRATDAGRPRDAGRADAGRCAGISDPLSAFLCQAGLGGNGIDDIIGGLLDGGAPARNCARETDLIAIILCQLAGGGGIDDIIDDLLGGRRDAGSDRADAGRADAGSTRRDGGIGLPIVDGGLDRGALVQILQRIIEDLFAALFNGGLRPRGAELSELRISSGEKSARVDQHVRSAEQCADAAEDDLATQLICAHQALSTLE